MAYYDHVKISVNELVGPFSFPESLLTRLYYMCWCHLDVGSEDRVVVDQLVARDVEGGEGGEGCEQRGGQRVQLIVRQAQVRQVGQHAVILTTPPGKIFR